jgi:hypothetical protein
LTKIEVKVQAKSGEDLNNVRNVWGKVKKIEVAGQPNAYTLQLPAPVAAPTATNNAATLTATGSVALELKNATGGTVGAIDLPATAASFGYAMFLPITTTAGITLNVYTESKTGSTPAYTAVAVSNQAFAKSTGYVITLSFSISGANPIDVSVSAGTTLGTWQTGTTIPKEL